MAVTEEIRLLIKTEIGKSSKELKKLLKDQQSLDAQNKKLNKSSFQLSKTMVGVAAALGTVVAAMKFSIKAASDLEEAQNKFNVVFGENKLQAEEWSQTLVASYGMSERASKEYLSSIQDLLKPMGVQPQLAAEMSNQVVKLAADLGSFNNMKTDEVLNKLRSAMVGNYETVKDFGTELNETIAKQEAANLGWIKGKEALTGQQKALIAIKQVMEANADAIGDTARSQETFAFVMKKLQARLEDLGASVGKEMLPGLIKLGSALIMVTEDGGLFIQSLQLMAKGIGILSGGLANIVSLFGAASDKMRLTGVNEDLKQSKEAIKAWGNTARAVIGENRKAGEDQIDTLKRMAQQGSSTAKRLVSQYDSLMAKGKENVEQGGKLTESFNKQVDAIWGPVKNGSNAVDEMVAKRKEEVASFISGLNEMDMASKGSSDARKQMAQKALEEARAMRQTDTERELEELTLKQELIREMQGEDKELYLEELEEFEERKKEIITRNNLETANFAMQQAQKVTSTIGNALKVESQIREKKLQRDHAKKSAFLKLAIKDEDERAKAQQILDWQTERKKRKLKRETAVREKALAITQAAINTGLAITAAMATVPFIPLGIIAVALAAAMGAAAIATIAARPIPAAETGAMVAGSAEGTLMRVGERNKSELIVPFENEEVQDRVGGGEGGAPTSVMNVQNFYAMGDAKEMAENVDRELFKLRQDGASVFAEAIEDK